MACCEKIVLLEVDIINGEKLPCKREVAFSLKDFSIRGIEGRNYYDMESGTLYEITAMYVMGYGIEYGIIDYENVNNIFAGISNYCVCLSGCGVLLNGQTVSL